jgi:hypothetical protein
MRTAAKIDRNQPEIVEALRRAGCSVQILSAVGKGCVDLLVGKGGINYCLEVKDGDLPPSRKQLTSDEQKWRDDWQGQAAVVESIEEALAAVGMGFGAVSDQLLEARRPLWERMGKE